MTLPVYERNAFILKIIKFIARLVLSPFFRFEWKGLENLPVKDPFVLLPKHQRWEDIPLLGMAIVRPLYYMAKHELFLNHFSRWFIGSLGGLPVNRSRPGENQRSFDRMISHLRNGEGVVIFPEGTYYENIVGPGKMGLLKIIFSQVSVPFLPVGIRYAKMRLRMLVRIEVGEPVYRESWDSNSEFLEYIMKEIARLSDMKISLLNTGGRAH
jgi:1-acyl-sn-glycerol-3-phosphate acyltransferase